MLDAAKIVQRLAAYSAQPHAQTVLVWLVLILAPTGGPEWMSFHPHKQPKCHFEAVPPPFRTLAALIKRVPETFGDPRYAASYGNRQGLSFSAVNHRKGVLALISENSCEESKCLAISARLQRLSVTLFSFGRLQANAVVCAALHSGEKRIGAPGLGKSSMLLLSPCLPLKL